MFVRDCHEILMNLCLDCNCLLENREETVRAAVQCEMETKQSEENDKLEV